MTENASDEDRLIFINAGMNDHIAKPVDANKLDETLHWTSSSCTACLQPVVDLTVWNDVEFTAVLRFVAIVGERA